MNHQVHAEESWNKALKRKPKPDYIGISVHFDNPVVHDGINVMGGFLWFSSSTMFIDFATSYYPYCNSDRYKYNQHVCINVYHKIITKSMSLNGIKGELNYMLSDDKYIDWIGTFSDLCSSDQKYPKYIRCNFRKSRTGLVNQAHDISLNNSNLLFNPLSGHIEPKLRSEFLLFISKWHMFTT